MNDEIELQLAILGPRQTYQVTAKNYATGKVENAYLKREDVAKWCLDLNKNGYVTWLSINDKERDCIDGVLALCDFWLDIDARPKGVDDRTATEQELLSALERANKIKAHVESKYGSIGFMASSGNGYHVHFPLPRSDLPTELRGNANKRVKAFAILVSAVAQVKIDTAYDINRKTTLIGTLNLKIPDKPLPTKWDKEILSQGLESALKYVDTARHQNTDLLDTILKTEPKREPRNEVTPNENHISLEQLRVQNRKLDDLLNGELAKYNYESRSEAEEAVLVILVMEGFSDSEINAVMDTCKIGKWQEKTDGYKVLSMEHAREQANKYIATRQTTQSVSSQEKQSQADRLVALCLKEEPTLFKDQTGAPFAWVNQKGVKVTVPLRSRVFKSWLSSLLWDAEQKAPGNEALSSALNVLVSKAMFDGPRITLYNRVACGEDCFWIDMTDDKHRAIKVSAEGWAIVDNPPMLFKRHSHQLPLAIPTREDKKIDAWRLLDFFNMSTAEDEQEKNDCRGKRPNSKLVVLCQSISFLIPNIPHPILILHGSQGNGKSVFCTILKRLLDPSTAELIKMPNNENERIQMLEHHWLCAFDNVTNISDSVSDTLCRAITGSGFSKRELYTDDEDVLYNFRRCILLNGINVAATRGDLLDRSTIEGLKDIAVDKRRTEAQILADFEKVKSEILGAFLDTLVKAIQLYPKVTTTKLFRMADFTKWGIAISQALGNTENDFLDAYEVKVNAQKIEAAYASPLATVLLHAFEAMPEYQNWLGTPTELYMRLSAHAKTMGLSTHQKAWPKNQSSMTRKLNELVPSLLSLGVQVETGIRTGQDGTRKVRINAVSTVSPVSVHKKHGENTDGTTDGTDATKNAVSVPSVENNGQSTYADDTDATDETLRDIHAPLDTAESKVA